MTAQRPYIRDPWSETCGVLPGILTCDLLPYNTNRNEKPRMMSAVLLFDKASVIHFKAGQSRLLVLKGHSAIMLVGIP